MTAPAVGTRFFLMDARGSPRSAPPGGPLPTRGGGPVDTGAAGPVARWGGQTEVLLGRVVYSVELKEEHPQRNGSIGNIAPGPLGS
jgi:hypothetical protein